MWKSVKIVQDNSKNKGIFKRDIKRGADNMNWRRLWNKFCSSRMKLWMEIGLAIVLVFSMGIAGVVINKAENEKIKAVQKTELAEVENQAARKVADSEKENTGTAEQAEVQNGAAEEVIADGQYPIMGSSSVTVEQMVEYFQSRGVEYPQEELSKGGADSIETFCQMYYEEATAEGIRPEVAFAQTMKETGWLQYGGDASIEQFNFAGIGTTGGGEPGNSYPDVRTGIRAQIQHLKAYATEDALEQECVDDRYEYVTKGSAPYVEWLGQNENPQGCGWATAENYGYSIVEMINKMKAMD